MATVIFGQNEKLYEESHRGPSISVSFEISLYLAMRFQRRVCFFQKSTNEKQELPMAAMFINGSGLYEQSLNIYLSVDMIFQSLWFHLLCLTPLAAIFQQYHGDQF